MRGNLPRRYGDENYPKLAATAFCGLDSATSAQRTMNPFPALQSNKIVFNMQPIALVLAETFEQARYAARLVKATYRTHLISMPELTV